MLQLAFVLIGPQAFRSRWFVIVIAGGILALLVVLMPALDLFAGLLGPAQIALGLLFVAHGLLALPALAEGGLSSRRLLDLAKAGGFLLLGALLLVPSLWSPLTLALLFGAAFILDGLTRAATAILVRFAGWTIAVGCGLLEIVFAVVIVADWPLPRTDVIPLGVGLLLGLSAWLMIQLGLMLRTLEDEAAILNLPIFAGRGWYEHAPVLIGEEPPLAPDQPSLTVHVWTPTGSADKPERRLLIDRYIAAVDANGEVSTGHSALEVAPDVYISHYPAIDLKASAGAAVLHSGTHNNMAGSFQPSYAAECADWCEADAHVAIRRYSPRRLRAFWIGYRQDSTYNLTARNCSTVVAAALDAALESTLACRRPWLGLLKLLLNPDLWAAAWVRSHALSGTWTPGLVLDYARALSRVVDHRDLSWGDRLRRFLSRTPHSGKAVPR